LPKALTKEELDELASQVDPNNVPLADWGTTYRPNPKTITDFLGHDSHNNTTPAASDDYEPLPAQGGVPFSNHWGDNLSEDDRDLSVLRSDLIQQAKAANRPTTASAVGVSLEDMNYDPEEAAGDIIPDRDKPSDSGETTPEEPPVDETEPEPEPEEPPDQPETDESLPALP